MVYLINVDDDPFSKLYEYSLQKNLITIKSVTGIMEQIITIIIKNIYP